VTKLVHGEDKMHEAERITEYLTGRAAIGEAGDVLEALRQEIPAVQTSDAGSVIEALVSSGLAESNTEARRLLQGNAIAINGQKVAREQFEPEDFQNGRLLLRRGKAFKDSALVEL
jgi:tyrosyl-tRNA synthetase